MSIISVLLMKIYRMSSVYMAFFKWHNDLQVEITREDVNLEDHWCVMREKKNH